VESAERAFALQIGFARQALDEATRYSQGLMAVASALADAGVNRGATKRRGK